MTMKFSSRATVALMASLMLLLFLLAPASEAQISCNDVITDLRPCVDYLTSGSGMPPTPCCDGASALASAATSTADRQTACNCLKSLSSNMNIDPSLARALPGNCGISMGYTIDPNMDCSTVS